MLKLIFCTAGVLFLSHQVGRTQVVVNPDGSHSVVAGNVIVNPDGSHSVISGNVIVNPNGSHSVIAGNVLVNPNGTHSVIAGNVLVNPDGSHSIFHGNEKFADAKKANSALRFSNREPGDFEKWISHLFGKTKFRNLASQGDTLKLDTLKSGQK